MVFQPGLSLVERSLLAALGGRLGPLLTVCRQWDDRLWAYVTASVEYQLSSALHRLGRCPSPSDTTGIDLADFTLDSIHQELSASEDSDSDAYQQICKFIMLDDPDNAVAFMYEWLADRSDAPPLHVLRFMAHVILVFQRLQIRIPSALAECIIELYVKRLISMKQNDTIALYAAQLPIDKAVHLFAQYMEGINDAGKRRETLKRADEVGFDTLQLCRMVVDRVRSVCVVAPSDDDQSSVFETQPAPEQETRLIEALDWLTVDPRLCADAVHQSNAIVRAFLAADKAEKAREALSRVDADAVEVARMVWEREHGAEPAPVALEVDCKEHLCLRAYLEAHDAFDRWFACVHRSRPASPDGRATSGRAQSFTERAEAELLAKRHEAELQRWQQSCHIYAEAAVRSLENVLLFPDGGWLIDRHRLEHDDDDDDDDRRRADRRAELELLRRRCLSRAAFMLATVLSESGRLREALRLADLIASEQHALHSAMDPAELRKLLRLLADCATRALEDGEDATGVATVAHRE
uniref:Nuclear pore complex protein n=1 Tax=Plectus sambesii TaxID=2011161 RepID=A0A914XEC3_9BILA